MNGPSPRFLANVWAPFAAGEQLAGVGPASPSPVLSVAGAQPNLPPMLSPPGGPGAAANVAPPPPAAPPDPHLDDRRMMSVETGPKPPLETPAGPSQPQGPPVSGGNTYPLQVAYGGGMTKARELERRGPSLLAAQGNRNEASEQTIETIRDRNTDAAGFEMGMAIEHERAARDREQAAAQSMAERQAEMQQRQADFDQSAKQLSQMSVDPDRFWATRSTGQRVSAIIGLMAGGWLAGATGQRNQAVDTLNQMIDRDIKAQEATYSIAREGVHAKQTAFSMAMQKYQNVDAARAVAKAAALETAQAQLAQVSARWKGTESQNRADMASAALQDEKMMQIANGIQFIPSQYQGRTYVDPRTGLRYTEHEAKAIAAKVDERDFENRKQTAGIGGQIMLEEAKGEAALRKEMVGKADEGASKISQQLQTAGVPQARVAAEEALAALNKSEGGRVEANVRSMLPDSTGNMVMSGEANEREQKYQAFANAAMKALMGNVTAAEEERARRQFGSAADPQSRRIAIQSALKTLEEIEKNAKAGQSPVAQSEFDRRRENAKGDKPPAPPSAAKGWK